MTVEEESIEFLQTQMETGFQHLMSTMLVDEIEWLEFDELRAIARLKGVEGERSNIICLFPPFNPNNQIPNN